MNSRGDSAPTFRAFASPRRGPEEIHECGLRVVPGLRAKRARALCPGQLVDLLHRHAAPREPAMHYEDLGGALALSIGLEYFSPLRSVSRDCEESICLSAEPLLCSDTRTSRVGASLCHSNATLAAYKSEKTSTKNVRARAAPQTPSTTQASVRSAPRR